MVCNRTQAHAKTCHAKRVKRAAFVRQIFDLAIGHTQTEPYKHRAHQHNGPEQVTNPAPPSHLNDDSGNQRTDNRTSRHDGPAKAQVQTGLFHIVHIADHRIAQHEHRSTEGAIKRSRDNDEHHALRSCEQQNANNANDHRAAEQLALPCGLSGNDVAP